MLRSEILEAIVYREGMLFKALDESGEPLLRKGQQVYKTIDSATSAERAFWNKEKQGELRSAGAGAFSLSSTWAE